MATSHFRVSNSLDHLRTEVKGNNCSSSNADLLILRKLIQEENCSLDQENLDHTGSGYFRAPTVPDRFSVNRIGAPGHWAAEARRHTFRESQPSVEEYGFRGDLPPMPLPDAAAVAAADERRVQAAAAVAAEEARKCTQYSPPQDFDDYSKGGRGPVSPPVEVLADVDYETARQVEVAEQSIASSWLSRLFGLGAFHTDIDKRILSKPGTQTPPPKTPLAPPVSKQHWIPEQSQQQKVADVAAVARANQTPTITGMLNGLNAIVPENLKPSTKEQGIVSSLGLVLGINRDKEVVFVRALPNSPADALLDTDETKLQEKDVLFAVDGDPVYKWPLAKVVNKLAGPKDTVANLHLLRGNPEGADQEKSIKDGRSKRVFVTLIRDDANDQDPSTIPPPDGTQAGEKNSRHYTEAFDFDCYFQVEEEAKASARLGRQPLLSELQLQRGEGLPVQNADEQPPSFGVGTRGKTNATLCAKGAMSNEIDEEMKALKDRLSAKTRLSLGHSMLRPVENQVNPMAANTLMAIRNDEHVSVNLDTNHDACVVTYDP